MSASPAGASSAPTKGKQMRVSGARLPRAHDRNAPVTDGWTVPAQLAPAALTVEAQQRLSPTPPTSCAARRLQRRLPRSQPRDLHADAAALRDGRRSSLPASARNGCSKRCSPSRGPDARPGREPVDLAATAAQVLRAHDHHGLRSTTALEPARTTGDPPLIERLIANLVRNAVRHNIPGGRIDVATYTAAGRATFTIANTGLVIPAGELIRLFEPSERLGTHP